MTPADKDPDPDKDPAAPRSKPGGMDLTDFVFTAALLIGMGSAGVACASAGLRGWKLFLLTPIAGIAATLLVLGLTLCVAKCFGRRQPPE